MSIDTAFLLSAGLGTRMRPITDKLPKVLVEVSGRTLLDRSLDCLIASGITKVIVNVHYYADLVESHLSSRTDIDIHISDERTELLDSGGGIKRGLELLCPDEFIVMNADTFWRDSTNFNNLENLRMNWDNESMDMNLLLVPFESSVGYAGKGDFTRAQDGRLHRSDSASYIYSGAMITKSSLFVDYPHSVFSLNTLFDTAITQGRLYGELLKGNWYHVGTPSAITQAEQVLDE